MNEMSKVIVDITRTRDVGGIQRLVFFDNGYGASIINGYGTYGLELAVLEGSNENDFHLTYDTPITDDVIGHNTDESIDSLLKQISELPKKEN